MLSITCPSSTSAFRNRMLSGSSSCPVASRSSGYSYLKVTTWRYPSSLETARWIGRTLPHLIKVVPLDRKILRTRYQKELRPNIIGDPERHDRTLQMWIDAYFGS